VESSDELKMMGDLPMVKKRIKNINSVLNTYRKILEKK